MSETNYAAKIAALLAKAESTDSAAEAEALSAAAEKLMIKWGVTDAMAAEAAAGLTAAEPIIERRQQQTGTYHQAWLQLASSVSNGLGSLRLLQTKWRNGTTVYIIGHESDVDRFFTLFESLKAQAEGAMRQWWKTADKHEFRLPWSNEIDQNRAFQARRAFIMSFGFAVHTRLREERRAVVTETTGAELVLVGRKARVDEAVSAMYPKLSKGRSGNMNGSYAGSTAGRAAGQRADLRGTRAVSR